VGLETSLDPPADPAHKWLTQLYSRACNQPGPTSWPSRQRLFEPASEAYNHGVRMFAWLICVTHCRQGSCCSHNGAVVAPVSGSGGSHNAAAFGTSLQLSFQVQLALLLGICSLSLKHWVVLVQLAQCSQSCHFKCVLHSFAGCLGRCFHIRHSTNLSTHCHSL